MQQHTTGQACESSNAYSLCMRLCSHMVTDEAEFHAFGYKTAPTDLLAQRQLYQALSRTNSTNSSAPKRSEPCQDRYEGSTFLKSASKIYGDQSTTYSIVKAGTCHELNSADARKASWKEKHGHAHSGSQNSSMSCSSRILLQAPTSFGDKQL